MSSGPDPDEYARALGYAMIEYWLLLGIIRAMSWVSHDPDDFAVGQLKTMDDSDARLIDHFVKKAGELGSHEQVEEAEELAARLHALRRRRNELVHSMYLLPDADDWHVPNQRVDPRDLLADKSVEEVTVATFVEFRQEAHALHVAFVNLAFSVFGEPKGFERRPGGAV